MTQVKFSRRKERIGIVLSNRMKNTLVVKIVRLAPHPAYRKIQRFISKVKVHDENGTAKEGDKVRIVETRPISKEKRWRLKEVLKSS